MNVVNKDNWDQPSNFLRDLYNTATQFRAMVRFIFPNPKAAENLKVDPKSDLKPQAMYPAFSTHKVIGIILLYYVKYSFTYYSQNK